MLSFAFAYHGLQMLSKKLPRNWGAFRRFSVASQKVFKALGDGLAMLADSVDLGPACLLGDSLWFSLGDGPVQILLKKL